MVFNKHSLVSKLKQALPLLQEVVLRNFLDGNTFGDIKSVMEQSSHFLRTVNSLLLVEKLHDTHALGSIELPFSPVDEIFKGKCAYNYPFLWRTTIKTTNNYFYCNPFFIKLSDSHHIISKLSLFYCFYAITMIS